MSVLITMRNPNSPYTEIQTLDISKMSGPVPSGEQSSTFKFRLWNNFGGTGSSIAKDIKFSISISDEKLAASSLNTGSPPPFVIRQIKSGVGDVEYSTVETNKINVGFNAKTNMWKYFSIDDNGYGSSGNTDGILDENGWAEFEIYVNVPDVLQTRNWLFYIYLTYNEDE